VPNPTYQLQLPADGQLASASTYSAYTIEGARRRLGDIGRTTVYGLISSGKLEAVKLGSRTLVTAASIEALLASLPRVSNKPRAQRDGTAR
jgi:excisionase family DNA binding protein